MVQERSKARQDVWANRQYYRRGSSIRVEANESKTSFEDRKRRWSKTREVRDGRVEDKTEDRRRLRCRERIESKYNKVEVRTKTSILLKLLGTETREYKRRKLLSTGRIASAIRSELDKRAARAANRQVEF